MRTDAELVKAVADGDRGAFRELHDRHVAWLTSRVARRCTDRDVVAEAVQDTFVAIWRGAATWDGRGDPAAWMWGIAIRRLIGVLRTRQRWARVRRPLAARPEVVVAAEEQVLHDVEHGDLGGALLQLSPELRMVVQATVLDGLSTREAARLLGIPQGTVKTRMMRARELRAPRSDHMTTSAWHAAPEALARYAQDPSGVDHATAASVETHLLSCDRCRAKVGDLADPTLAATSWDAVIDRVDQPRESALQAALELLGVRSGPARLAAATRGLRLSGIGAVAGLTVLAVAAARHADASGPFLALAPLVPLAAVAFSFAASADPGGEAGLAAPLQGAGLAMRRAGAVLVLAFTVLAISAVAVPSMGSAPLVWLLPASAIALGSLALATWVRLEAAATGLVLAWLAGAGTVRRLDGFDRAFVDTVLFAPAGQATALTLTLAACVVLATRSDRFSTVEAGL